MKHRTVVLGVTMALSVMSLMPPSPGGAYAVTCVPMQGPIWVCMFVRSLVNFPLSVQLTPTQNSAPFGGNCTASPGGATTFCTAVHRGTYALTAVGVDSGGTKWTWRAQIALYVNPYTFTFEPKH